MLEDLHNESVEGALEALLFVSSEPVGAITLAEMIDRDVATVESSLIALRDRLAHEGRGIQLREVAGGWRLCTHPAYHDIIEKYVLSWDTRKLSSAALETLAIVAYVQPVTRATISSIRGVNSDSSVNSLLDKALIREVGTDDAPGNPMLYGTTQGFLEKFGLRSVKDLPELESFAPDDETRMLISERLSATRREPEVSEEAARMMAEAMMEQTDSTEMASAFASAFGVVDKIDFDTLQFDTEDE